ncbi:MAG TPA: hypothetical protein VK099_04595 [Alcanivoracaceae bacterium]|nr:hypothetical protein [Alcanivoracaceae bacterium]
MNEEHYHLVWMIYLGAAAVSFIAGWWLTRRWYTWISYPLRAVAFAVLFTPWGVMQTDPHKAPAWAITAFDGLIVTDGEPLRAGAPLLAAIIIALIVATLLWGSRLYVLSRRPVVEQTDATEGQHEHE